MIRIQNLEKFFGHQQLFDDVTFNINPKEKIGLVGRNGTGKSTFLKLLLGEDSAQGGEIHLPEGFRIRALEQSLNFSEPTILKQVVNALPPDAQRDEWKAKSILMGLGFTQEDFNRAPSEFSSGFQIRIRLAEALVSDCDLLLLDEPTNYLDILSLRWLERFLNSWNHSFILVTHDQQFMEKVVTHSLIIHRGKMRKMKGGPQKLMDQIQLEEKVYEKTRQNQLKKKAQTQEFISKFRSGARSAGLVQSRIKMLEKQKIGRRLRKVPQIRFHFRSDPFKATTMLQAEGLKFGYSSDEILIDEFDLTVMPGDRIGIVGPNGKGKSTLLKLLAKRLKFKGGKLNYHSNLHIGYFGAEGKAELTPQKSILEELITLPEVNEKQVRQVCAALLFTGHNAKKKISALSGGEKSRVCLGKVLLYKNNLLMLDEPTNHLDLESCQALTQSLIEFEGSVIFVTHDEKMLSQVANRLIVFDAGTVRVVEKTYDEFLASGGWQDEEDAVFKKVKTPSEGKQAYLEAKRLKKEEKMKEKKLDKLDKQLKKLEEEKKVNDAQLHQACLDRETAKIELLGKKAKEIYEAIEGVYEEMEGVI